LPERGTTFVGRYKGIISDNLAVGNAPADLLPSPFAPIGESIAIGVEDMMAIDFIRRFEGGFAVEKYIDRGDKDCKRLAVVSDHVPGKS
jgi:hypothetical protein